MPLRLAADITWWAHAAAFPHAAVMWCARYDKRRKETHRLDICDTHGPVRLTVPVTLAPLPGSPDVLNSHIKVSAHGHWWTVHRTALESAYGRTPFFEFYIDRFTPLLTSRYEVEQVPLWHLCRDTDAVIASILGIDAPVYIPGQFVKSAADRDFTRLRPMSVDRPYWQIRRDRFGFLGSMSVLDLIFNLGPEAAVYLRDLIYSLDFHT